MLENSRTAPEPEAGRSCRRFGMGVGSNQLSTSTALTVTSKYKAAAAGAALALSVGVFGAAVPGTAPSTSAAPPGVSSVSTTGSVASAQSRAVAGRTSSPVLGRYAATDLARSDALSTDVQKRPSVKPIVEWLKKNARKHYDKLKAAVRKGYGAFKEWYYNLPKPIRATINFLWSGTLWGLFEALVKYFS